MREEFSSKSLVTLPILLSLTPEISAQTLSGQNQSGCSMSIIPEYLSSIPTTLLCLSLISCSDKDIAFSTPQPLY
jgi:hypothetical protein